MNDSLKRLTVENLFRLTVPGHWTWDVEVQWPLRLNTGSTEGSDVFIDRRAVDWTPSKVEEELLRYTEIFINDGVTPVLDKGHFAGASVRDVKTTYWNDGDTHCARTVIELGDDRIWLLLMVAKPKSSLFVFLHWNGPRKEMKRSVLSVFDSLELLGDQEDE